MSKSEDPTLTIAVEAVLADLGVATWQWDAVIFGDGSGTGWSKSCGWAAVLIEKRTQLRKCVHGAMSCGTSYLAEVMPYVHMLSWYLEGPGQDTLQAKLKLLASARVDVHIVTDNQTVAKQGAELNKRKTGNYYWAMLDAVGSRGYNLHWHWKDRLTTGLNRLCDHLAGRCRLSVAAVEGVALPEGVDAYTFNPSEGPADADPARAVEPTTDHLLRPVRDLPGPQ